MFDQNEEVLSTKTYINENLVYSGNGTELAILMFKNLALTFFTLGIYWAWGKTNTRRYLWGKVSFLEDRGSYTGTGKELFRGWVLIGCVYIVAMILINVLSKVSPYVGIALLPLYIYLFALAVYGGTRYRLSRTNWREISFSMERDKESTREFIWLAFKGAFLSLITLGLYYPVFQNNRRKFLVNRTHFGTAKFNYTGENRIYFWLFIREFLLTIITLGIYSPWMILNLLKFKLNNSNLENSLYFRIEMKGSELFVFSILAYFSTILTLGLALPWVIDRTYKLFVNKIEVFGEIDFTQITNVEATGSSIADVAIIEYDLELGF